jgi:hypothetical protein
MAFLESRHLSSSVQILIQAQQLIGIFDTLPPSSSIHRIDFCDLQLAGLGDAPGTAVVPDIDYGKPQDFGTVQISAVGSGTAVEIKTIDSLWLDRLDFIKLDVEGYECAALAGGIETIQTHRPYIWVEFFISGKEPIKATLAAVPDYAFFQVDYQNMLCIPRERLGEIKFSGVVEC